LKNSCCGDFDFAIQSEEVNERAAAEEHLRVIRSLMERATVYRAISAPTALVGGISALLTSSWIWWRAGRSETVSSDVLSLEFVCGWGVALAATLAANTLFLWRGAAQGKRPFWSAGLRLAIRSILPSIIVAAAVTLATIWMAHLDVPRVLSLTWIFLYGLALLATANFSPRSLVVLGWSFVIAGASWLLLLSIGFGAGVTPWESQRQATLAMALTFGLFHLVYAACTRSRRSDTEGAKLASE
jgi:hypothetical protein